MVSRVMMTLGIVIRGCVRRGPISVGFYGEPLHSQHRMTALRLTILWATDMATAVKQPAETTERVLQSKIALIH